MPPATVQPYLMSELLLPTATVLFARYLSPWYPAEPRPVQPRPDLFLAYDASQGTRTLEDLQYLPASEQLEVQEQIAAMVAAGQRDFQEIVAFEHLSLEVLQEVLAIYERAEVLELLEESDPTVYGNPMLVTIGLFGAVLGALLAERPGFGWVYAQPYFHSIVVHPATGLALPVFDWMVKKLSEDAIDLAILEKVEQALVYIAGQQ